MKVAVLVVFVDALGPEQSTLLSDAGLSLPHNGTLRGVLGYSSGAIPSILTGQAPAVHGRMCLFSRLAPNLPAPLQSLKLLGLLPSWLHERERVRRYAAKAISFVRGYDGYLALHRVPPELFSSLDIPEKDDIFKTRSIGSVPTFLARAREAGLAVVATDWHRPEASRVEQIEAHPNADLAFLYLSGLDAILHKDGQIGPNARAWARTAVGWIDRARKALTQSGRSVRTLVVGDHGMAQIQHIIDPRPTLKLLKNKVKLDFVFVDATMFRVGIQPEQLELAQAILQNLPGEVLDQAKLRATDAPTNGSYGDLIQVLPEGWLFAPSFVGGKTRGMHGYTRNSPSARAAILSDAADLNNVVSLEDIAPWVLSNLDLKEASTP